MHRHFTVVVFLALVACQAPTVSITKSVAEAAPAQSASASKEQKPSGSPASTSTVEDKRKELRSKQRALANAGVDHQVAAIDRRIKAMTVEVALVRSASSLESARAALALFLEQQKPRELAQKKIALDRDAWQADHAKDELGELIAMYDADEFAKTTKELVLKRGRRSLEIAERELELTRKELAEFENHTLPRRERELRDKVADAEVERKKAELEAEKTEIQHQLALRKEAETIADLEEEIAGLEREIAALAKKAEGNS